MNFASRLKLLRNDRMLSITKLAKKSGLSQSFVCRIESGEKQPTLETLHKLSHGLGISIGELLGEDLMNEPESPLMQRLIGNMRKLSPEQLEALDTFIASISNGYASGEMPLSLQNIQLNTSEEKGLEMELTFSSNVSAVMEHRIPDGTERNKSCFQLFDNETNLIPIELIPGNKRKFGHGADNTFFIRPLAPLDDNRVYTLNISRLLQANNYKYLKENHTITFSTSEIIDIAPYNKRLCISQLSLALEGCNLVSGDENVPVNADIKLTFSNDVCSQLVRDHNMNCFSLQTSKNQSVDIDVIMAEPNSNFENKKEIIVHPRYQLACNTTYILTISENLLGKSQKSLCTDKVISFTTGNAVSSTKAHNETHSIA